MTTIEKNREASNNIDQNLIEECIRMDQKAQFQIYKLYYKEMFNIMLNDARRSWAFIVLSKFFAIINLFIKMQKDIAF